MINPPDELLEDLQQSLPPEAKAASPAPHKPSGGVINGHTSPDHDHLAVQYDKIEDVEDIRGYDAPGEREWVTRAGSTMSQVCVVISHLAILTPTLST